MNVPMNVALALLASIVVKGVAANCPPTSSSCNDSVTFLQSRSQHSVRKDDEGCDLSDLNQGLCVEPLACTQCDLQGTENDLPSDAQRFPDGCLLCLSTGTPVCSLADDSEPITFKESSQVMVCEGSSACIDWRVRNFGALCCASTSNGAATCADSAFELQSDPLCQNDVCCDGFQTCIQSDFNNVESLLCQGGLACTQSTFYISRDLYCNEFSPLTINPTTNGSTCSDSNFFLQSENHVVDCLGNDVCSRSTLSFSGDDTNISMLCDSAQGGAGGSGGACVGATINLSPGDCLDLNCTQPEDCVDMTVNENGGTCFFIGAPDAPNIPPGCEQKNTTQCGPIIPDEICCRADEPPGKLCGSCCEEPSSTSSVTPPPDITSTTTTTGATTTSTKKKPKPYQYSGRNRRQHRRWDRRQRRQHRRDYRQYG